MQTIIIHTDGGARGNPGPAAIGVAVFDEKLTVLHEISRCIGVATNNVAEYDALIAALLYVVTQYDGKLFDIEVLINMDSELIVRQVAGVYKVKDATLKEKFAEVMDLMSRIPHVRVVHVRRAQNAEADALVNKALDAQK